MTGAVHGYVAPGFEGVLETFAQVAQDFGDGGGAIAAYHEGQLVVDLQADPWDDRTTAQYMSVTKAPTALCVQMLHDRGQLDVFAPVADVWPEFAAAGKSAITVADVLTHRSGVIGDDAVTALIDLESGAGMDGTEEITAALAAGTPYWEPGTQVGYHTTSYGWILGEVIRRVDGRDLGTFFREEVAKPLGVEVGIGVPEQEHDRIAPVLPMRWPDMPPEISAYVEAMLGACRDETTAAGVSCQARGGVGALDRLDRIFNRADARTVPLGGSNLTGTARDVARIFANMAELGSANDVSLASPASFATFTDVHEDRPDAVLLLPLTRGLGYIRNIPPPGRPPSMGPHPEAFGHGGVGGQIGYADPVARVGLAMVRNHYTAFSAAPLFVNAALYQAIG